MILFFSRTNSRPLHGLVLIWFEFLCLLFLTCVSCHNLAYLHRFDSMNQYQRSTIYRVSNFILENNKKSGQKRNCYFQIPVDAYKLEFEFCAMKVFFQLTSQYIVKTYVLETLNPNNFNNKMIPSSKLTLLTKELLIILA